MKKWQDWKINKIKSTDSNFPKVLSKISDPVKSLYYRGNWNLSLFKNSLAIVGSRRNTRYGEQVVKILLAEIVSSGITTISGFMYGVDSLVHNETIDCGGKTIAVLGSGLDVLYPARNNDLYSQILESGGLVLSEYEANTKPALWTFPVRNRIVVGLASMGVLIVEAGLDSGSLVTANIALNEGKKVYCVPGPITSSVSAGCNLWIKNNKAKMVTGIEDILNKKQISNRQSSLFDGKGEIEKKILTIIENEPLTMDELVVKTGINISELSVSLSMLQMDGVIEEVGGKYYLRR